MTRITASTVRSAVPPRRLRASAVLATLVATLVPAVWAGGSSAATPPEGRGYEMVSPPEKNFGDIVVGTQYFGDIATAPDGEAASFCTTANFTGTSAGTVCGDYVSRRDAGDQRWKTTPVSPPYCTIDNADPSYVWQLQVQFLNGLSADMSKAVVSRPEGGGGCPFDPLDPLAPAPSTNLYMFDEIGNPASARLVAPRPGAPSGFSPLQTGAGGYQAGSSDLSHIVFQSTGQQTSEVPADGQSRLFEWAGGDVRLLTRDTGNVPFATDASLASPTPFFRGYDSFNAVSADGSRIFFVTPTSGDVEIYMRENGTTTYDVSASECTSACGPTAEKRFMYATPDGKNVLLRSAQRLTDDPTPSGANLYLYTHSADPASDQNLTLLTRDDEPADGTVATDILSIGVIGAADDGDDVYFVADGQLVAGAPTGPGQKLYHWQAGDGQPTLSYLATFPTSSGTEMNWSEFVPSPDRLVTPDGKHLLLQTAIPLDPVADQNTDVASTMLNVLPGSDVYRWSENEGWICISCTGTSGSHGGFIDFDLDHGTGKQTDRKRAPISDDGRRVTFQSTFAIEPQDTNGGPAQYQGRDVYQWEDGTVQLISSGKSPDPVVWVGSSSDGDDVFFTTRERLVGWDTDSNNDLYDARVGGGFPEPPPSSDPCTGDECQNAPAAPPAPSGSGSGDFNGSGNVGAGARASISGIRGLSASARSTLANGGKARLSMKVNRSGRVTVVGRAKVGRKSSRVASSSAQARKAGAVSVPFALSRGARAELRRKGSLKVTLTVRFRDARPQALTFTVKSASSKRGRR